MPVYQYQGVHYDISETDPAVAKSKILAHLGKSEAAHGDLADRIPGTPEQPKYTEPAAAKRPAFSAVEAGLSAVTGAAATIAGQVAGLGAGILSGEGMKPGGAAESVAGDIADKFTYQPRSEAGKRYVDNLNSAIESAHLPAFMPEMAGAGAALSGKAASQGAKAAGKVAAPIVDKAAELAGKGISKLTPIISKDVASLHKEGVKMTPGQILGRTTKAAEEMMTSKPVVGAAITAAHRRGHESLAEAAFNRALAPVGKKLPKGLTGHEAISHIEGELGAGYEDYMANNHGSLDASGVSVGESAPTLRGELNSLREMAIGGKMPKKQLSELNSIIDNEVIGQFTAAGKASGETLKNIESKLGQIAKKKALSADYHDTRLGDAVKEIQASVRRMVERENPASVGEKRKLDEAWAHFKRVQHAAASPGASKGLFSPRALGSAVRATGSTRDHANIARGGALMQDLSEAGKNVLAPSVSDSGTAGRIAMMDMFRNPVTGVVGGAASVLYHPLVQDAIQKVLMKVGKEEK